jgi:type II secretory pathway component GspD/PulD (secretin)
MTIQKQKEGTMLKLARCIPLFALAAAPSLFGQAVSRNADEASTQTLRFVQDDAQDYMVSKIYRLKYIQANDITPFVMGIVMRYNMNSTVNCVEYGANNAQMLTVTCPVEMMPYVDDFIAKADRNVLIDGKVPGDIVKGTGITRAVYRPKYRSGQALLNVLVDSQIGEGVYSSVYAWDHNSNQIYWKDNSSNTQYVYQFLGYLDRPAPQITLTFQLYEVRESTFRDLGIEYLAWKNGPGMNIFQVGFDVINVTSAGTAALNTITGPVGGFLAAPQFDASFIRLLAQRGNAKITDTATLTVANSDSESYSLLFNPQLQNIVKSDNDAMSVVGDQLNLPEGFSQVGLTIDSPLVNLHYGESQAGYPASEAFSVNNYEPGTYTDMNGTLFFSYNVQTANVVERAGDGTELVETSEIASDALIPLNEEIVLGQWNKEQDVEQTIGIPWLCRIPILKYLFSTVTTSRENTRVYLTVTAKMLDTAHPQTLDFETGELKKVEKAEGAMQ